MRIAIVTLVLFGLNGLLLAQLDQPLIKLADGESKLDLKFGYDLTTVQRLLDAYGEEGRSIYVWNLIADTPFPVFGAIAVSMFVLIAFKNQFWRAILVSVPLIFGLTDLVENTILLSIIKGYPAIPSLLVDISSMVTQIKRTAYFASMLELILCVILIIVARLRFRKRPLGSRVKI